MSFLIPVGALGYLLPPLPHVSCADFMSSPHLCLPRPLMLSYSGVSPPIMALLNCPHGGRLLSTIVGAGIKLGPLRLPLPLTGRVGYLEFVYQDDDIRVTRGNRYAAVTTPRVLLHPASSNNFPDAPLFDGRHVRKHLSPSSYHKVFHRSLSGAACM